MSNKEKKIKRKLIRFIFLCLILIFIVVYSIWAFVSVIKNPSDTFLVEEGKLSLEERAEAYIIREENVIYGERNANEIVKIKDVGQKVAKDDAIFRYKSSSEEDLTKKIDELNVKIEQALEQENKSSWRGDIALLEEQIKNKLEEVINQNDIQKINKTKSEINSLINRKARIAGEYSPAGSYIKKLINERVNLENELNSNSQYITSPVSGVVTYAIDGYEDILSASNLDSITKDILNSINVKTGQAIAESDKSAKIINNFVAYIAVITKSDNALTAKVGDKVKLQFVTLGEIDAVIEKIQESDGKERIIFFKIKNGIEATANYRKLSVDIIWWSSNGLKVPNAAIMKEGERFYVIKNRAGYTDKIMIKILKQNEAYSIIDNYETNELKELGYSSTEINKFKKIFMYDEIIIYNDEKN